MELSQLNRPRKPIKVAMIGSCVTRDIFSSHFNKDYKNVFELVVVCYQRTIMSLMSGKIDYILQEIEPLDDWDLEMVTAELDNTFLEDLIEQKPDLLIVDLYTDARFKTIPIKNSYLTVNEWKTIKTDLYLNALKKNRVFSPTDKQLTESFSELKKFLENHLPNIKIILNQARGVNSYTDKDGEEKFFNIPFVNRLNKRWERMDKLFIETVNPIQLDVMTPDVKGYINHIWNVEYIHYTPNFYHDFYLMLLVMIFKNQKELLKFFILKLSKKKLSFEYKLELIKNIRSLYISLNTIENKYFDSLEDGIYRNFFLKLSDCNKSIDKYIEFVLFTFSKDKKFISYMLNRVINKKIFNHEENNFIKGCIFEKEQKYMEAIDSYLLVSLERKKYQSKIYYHLANCFMKLKKYQEASEAFLLIDGSYFREDKCTEDEKSQHRKILYAYLKSKEGLTLDDYLELAKKAEELKCWSVSSYGYKEYIQQDEGFNKKVYLSLAHSLMQEKRYKEASYYLLEQYLYDETLNLYEAYREALFLDDKIIFYANDSLFLSECLDIIEKDAFFDGYRHVLAVDNLETVDKNMFKKDVLVINKNSNLYKRYLAQSKYILASESLPQYFKRKKEQVYLFIKQSSLVPVESSHSMKQGSSITDMIQEVFFENRKEFHGLKERKSEYTKLYRAAIKEFNEEKWQSSHTKFKEVAYLSKDITKKLPTLYYLKESNIQNLVENKDASIELLIPYGNYQSSAENFAGIESLLFRASTNSSLWKGVLDAFIPILDDMKKCDRKGIRSIADKRFLAKVEAFSKQINNSLEANLLPYQAWFVFADIFIFARLYKKYHLAREKALESTLKLDEILTINQKRHKLNALSEFYDEENYTLLRNNILEEHKEDIKKNFQLLGLSELFFNKRDSAIEFLKSFYNEDDKLFSAYIKNKTIAIVGPVDSKLNLGKEIDQHDVVIRFNYNGLDDSLHDAIGKKTTVSYYIIEILIKDKFDKNKIEKINELDWAIFDTQHRKDSICFLGVEVSLRQRALIAHPHLNSYFKGTANAIQRVLFDLLRFATGKITIYNTNLFLENNYHKNYKSRGTLGAEHLIFNWHDPLSNFIFLQRLKNFNIIDTDEVLSNILRMSSQEYINALEERYGIK